MMYKAASTVEGRGGLRESAADEPAGRPARCKACGHPQPALAAKHFGEQPPAPPTGVHGLGDRVQALESALAKERRKRVRLQEICDRQQAELQAAQRDAGVLGSKLADLVDMDTALQVCRACCARTRVWPASSWRGRSSRGPRLK